MTESRIILTGEVPNQYVQGKPVYKNSKKSLKQGSTRNEIPGLDSKSFPLQNKVNVKLKKLKDAQDLSVQEDLDLLSPNTLPFYKTRKSMECLQCPNISSCNCHTEKCFEMDRACNKNSKTLCKTLNTTFKNPLQNEFHQQLKYENSFETQRIKEKIDFNRSKSFEPQRDHSAFNFKTNTFNLSLEDNTCNSSSEKGSPDSKNFKSVVLKELTDKKNQNDKIPIINDAVEIKNDFHPLFDQTDTCVENEEELFSPFETETDSYINDLNSNENFLLCENDIEEDSAEDFFHNVLHMPEERHKQEYQGLEFFEEQCISDERENDLDFVKEQQIEEDAFLAQILQDEENGHAQLPQKNPSKELDIRLYDLSEEDDDFVVKSTSRFSTSPSFRNKGVFQRKEHVPRKQNMFGGAMNLVRRPRYPGIFENERQNNSNNQDIDLDNYEEVWDMIERIGDAKEKGATSKEMKMLQSYKFCKGPREVNDTSDCSNCCQICLSFFENKESINTMPCLHMFHSECIKKWLQFNAICPICRFSLKENKVAV